MNLSPPKISFCGPDSSPAEPPVRDATTGSISPGPKDSLSLNGQIGSAPMGRRMRSGSLFSTNSIWNDDALSLHSPSRGSASSFLDVAEQPTFLSPPMPAQPTRNRSHTTSGTAVPGGPMSAPFPPSHALAQSPPLLHPQDQAPFLLDNLVAKLPDSGTTRNRSQTYSGVAPNVSDFSPASHLALLQHHQHSMHQGHFAPPAGKPLLQNDFNFASLVITTNFENPSLGPTNTLLVDNVPQFLDAERLLQLFSNSAAGPPHLSHGKGIASVRVSPTSTTKMALVDCYSVETAMAVKAAFNHLELVPGVILYIAFAKLQERSRSPAPAPKQAPPKPPSPPKSDPPQLLAVVHQLAQSSPLDTDGIASFLAAAAAFPKHKYQKNFGPLPDPLPVRQFDSPTLRELRKTLEANERSLEPSSKKSSPVDGQDEKTLSQTDIEELALAMLDELPELCYDHIGNTVVQKVFALVESPVVRLMMVKEIAPYLTQLSIHKNGTWAVQKIINLCHHDYSQMALIAASLKPYAVKLFNDQFGNYVLQGCVKFGYPWNSFIFEAATDNFVEVACGRFGARCLRTVLETASESGAHVTREQLFLCAGMIVSHAVELVTNPNGSLLVTWYLDTFNHPPSADSEARYELLCSQFLPHLERMCMHKLANLTVVKILNNRSDLRVKHVIMDAIFGPYAEDEEPRPRLLETILAESHEPNAGPLLVYKIISNPLLMSTGNEYTNGKYHQFVVNQVKRVLLEMQITNLQPYKKLADEVGLSTNRLGRAGSAKKKRSRKPFGYNDVPVHYYPPPVVDPLYERHIQASLANQQLQQDVSVMQQLEQLSLSSAAMGYASTPDTPHQGPSFL